MVEEELEFQVRCGRVSCLVTMISQHKNDFAPFGKSHASIVAAKRQPRHRFSQSFRFEGCQVVSEVS